MGDLTQTSRVPGQSPKPHLEPIHEAHNGLELAGDQPRETQAQRDYQPAGSRPRYNADAPEHEQDSPTILTIVPALNLPPLLRWRLR